MEFLTCCEAYFLCHYLFSWTILFFLFERFWLNLCLIFQHTISFRNDFLCILAQYLVQFMHANFDDHTFPFLSVFLIVGKFSLDLLEFKFFFLFLIVFMTFVCTTGSKKKRLTYAITIKQMIWVYFTIKYPHVKPQYIDWNDRCKSKNRTINTVRVNNVHYTMDVCSRFDRMNLNKCVNEQYISLYTGSFLP